MYCSDTDFAHWAFGKDNWIDFLDYTIDTPILMEKWNELHSDLLLLHGHEPIQESLAKMKQLYEAQLDN